MTVPRARTLRRGLSLLAALASLATGAWSARQAPRLAEPGPERFTAFSVLPRAPIPPGSKVALSVPRTPPATPDLFEAAWLRPDLLWAPTPLWAKAPFAWDYEVILPGAVADPAPAVVVWNEAGVVVRRRTAP